MFFSMPQRYTLGPPLLSTVMVALLIACLAASLMLTVAGEGRPVRLVLLGAACVFAFSDVVSLSKVLNLVVYHAGQIDGIRLIQTAIFIWIGNVIIFAILYSLIGEREFLFPQSPYPEVDRPKTFLDYVFLSFTTATAFSPTDTAPLTTRARMLIMVESTVSLLTIAIAAARAINILPSGS
jgi:hypothetical protein